MPKDKDKSDGSVRISVEIEGEYDDVVPRIQLPEEESTHLDPLVSDIETVLAVLVRFEGGTRSAIAERLPDEMVATYEAEGLVDLLSVLERYDLVELEGNTWKPGPTLGDKELVELLSD